MSFQNNELSFVKHACNNVAVCKVTGRNHKVHDFFCFIKLGICNALRKLLLEQTLRTLELAHAWKLIWILPDLTAMMKRSVQLDLQQSR